MTHASSMVASLKAHNAPSHVIAMWESVAEAERTGWKADPIRHDDGGLAKALEASTQGMRPRAGTWVPESWAGLQDSIVAANQARLREIDRD